MAPMPSTKGSGKMAPTFQFSVADSDDSSPTLSSPPSTDALKSNCSSLSDGESFEGFRENDSRVSATISDGNNKNNVNNSSNRGVELELAPQVSTTSDVDEERSTISRHTWSRTSLRRTPTSNPDNLPNRRWGSMRHTLMNCKKFEFDFEAWIASMPYIKIYVLREREGCKT